VDALSEQIKQLTSTKEQLLDQQKQAQEDLKNKQKTHQEKLDSLAEVETKKRDVEQTLKECEDLIAQQPDDPSSTQPKYTLEHCQEGRQISITVELPGVENVGDVDLDVEDNALCLEAGKWELRLDLPPVDEENIRAKFVKETSTLVVTLASL